jgi:WD40 repeat protein
VTAYASAPIEDLLLRFDPGDLTESWRLPLTIQDVPLSAGGVAIDPGGTTVFVDVGDSLVRIDVSGSQPGPPEPFARAHRGSIVEVLPDGNLVAGGHLGLLLIDSASGEILNEFESSIYDLEVSPNGELIAVSGTFGLALLSSEDLSEVWGTFRGDAQGYSALSFSPSGDVFLALVRTSEEWVLSVIEAESGGTRHRYLLGPAAFPQSTEFMTRLTTHSADGRFAVFATGAGAFVADASTGMPIAREVEGLLDPLPLGCCNVVWTDAGPLFASGGGPFGEGALVKLRIDP